MKLNKKSQIHFELMIGITKIVVAMLVLIAVMYAVTNIIQETVLKKKLISVDTSLLYSTMSELPFNISYIYIRNNLAKEGFIISLNKQLVATNTIKENEKENILFSGNEIFRFVSTKNKNEYQCLSGKSYLKLYKTIKEGSGVYQYIYYYPLLVHNSKNNKITDSLKTYVYTHVD